MLVDSRRDRKPKESSARFTISLPTGQEITSYPAITRDGQTTAYVTQQGTDASQLYLRDLNSFEARAVPGSRGARQPFFAPDGKWVAFFAQGQLQKAEVAGGAPAGPGTFCPYLYPDVLPLFACAANYRCVYVCPPC